MTVKTDFNVFACDMTSELPQNGLGDRKNSFGWFIYLFFNFIYLFGGWD
jgi:hypothetical protein